MKNQDFSSLVNVKFVYTIASKYAQSLQIHRNPIQPSVWCADHFKYFHQYNNTNLNEGNAFVELKKLTQKGLGSPLVTYYDYMSNVTREQFVNNPDGYIVSFF